jgi:hypothetical protein
MCRANSRLPEKREKRRRSERVDRQKRPIFKGFHSETTAFRRLPNGAFESARTVREERKTARKVEEERFHFKLLFRKRCERETCGVKTTRKLGSYFLNGIKNTTQKSAYRSNLRLPL